MGSAVSDIGSDDIENRSAVALDFPYGVAMSVRTDIFQEGESMKLLPGQVVIVVCVSHQKSVPVNCSSSEKRL